LIPYLLVALAVVVVVLAIQIVTRPDDFRVTRSTLISAPPAAVFAQVNDFHQWENWSPWAKLDPNVRNTFTGPPAGPGAGFGWDGNSKVGAGRMTITESRPAEFIRIKLEFFKPFKATNTTEFTFKPEGALTNAGWSMFGKNNLPSKVMGLFMNFDRMIGGQFEQGLAKLKSIAETAAGPGPSS